MENSRELLAQYKAGDTAAAQAIYQRYAARLIAVARRMLAQKLSARIDPEDIVQSAYRSFFIEARDGRYELRQSGDLWRLLIAITRNKLLHEVERQTAARRAPEKETALVEPGEVEATPAEVLAVSEELQSILAELPLAQRQLLELRLRDASAAEIAAALGKSPRTVRRLLFDLRRTLERRLGAAASELAHARSPAPPLDRAAQLDYRDFRLDQMVGAGGFGKVYRAYWHSRQTTVAIKSLRKQFLIDSRAIGHFLREAEIIAGLEHPGIIRAHGLGRTPAGGYFLALDWQPGGDLSQRDWLTVREAVNFVAQAAEAIAYAHDHGVIHCDLKPSNLLLGADGRVVVTDFGFAHATRGCAGEVVLHPGGTAGFSAPELWAGQLSPACDVFSLGRVLRYLLSRVTGLSSNSETCHRLLAMANKCEQAEPAERGTARDLAEGLRSLLKTLA